MTETVATTREQDLRNQVDQALQLAATKPTAKNRKELKRAKAELDAFLLAAAEPESAEQYFSSILEVVDYLTSAGWKISKSSAYDHWKKDEKITARADGSFTRSEVERYARDHLPRKDGSTAIPSLSQERQRVEIRRIQSDTEMRELKLRERIGELIPRGQVESEFSERATNLKNYFDAIARSSAGRIVKLVDGDPQLASELISFLLGVNRKAFDNYSRQIDLAENDED